MSSSTPMNQKLISVLLIVLNHFTKLETIELLRNIISIGFMKQWFDHSSEPTYEKIILDRHFIMLLDTMTFFHRVTI